MPGKGTGAILSSGPKAGGWVDEEEEEESLTRGEQGGCAKTGPARAGPSSSRRSWSWRREEAVLKSHSRLASQQDEKWGSSKPKGRVSVGDNRTYSQQLSMEIWEQGRNLEVQSMCWANKCVQDMGTPEGHGLRSHRGSQGKEISLASPPSLQGPWSQGRKWAAALRQEPGRRSQGCTEGCLAEVHGWAREGGNARGGRCGRFCTALKDGKLKSPGLSTPPRLTGNGEDCGSVGPTSTLANVSLSLFWWPNISACLQSHWSIRKSSLFLDWRRAFIHCFRNYVFIPSWVPSPVLRARGIQLNWPQLFLPSIQLQPERLMCKNFEKWKTEPWLVASFPKPGFEFQEIVFSDGLILSEVT